MSLEKILDDMIAANTKKNGRKIRNSVRRTLMYGCSLPLKAYKKPKAKKRGGSNG